MAVTSGTQIKPHKNQMAANLLPYWWRSPPCVDLKKIFIALKAWSLVMLRSSWQNELVYTLDSVIGNIAVFWDNKEQDTVPLGAKVVSAECDMWSNVHSDQWPTVLPLGQWTRIQSQLGQLMFLTATCKESTCLWFERWGFLFRWATLKRIPDN